jgi:glutathione S-transferase
MCPRWGNWVIELFGHPFSSYTWKALIALYETNTPFVFRNVAGTDHPENEAAFLAHWPIGKFPLLVDNGEPIMESSVIVEYVAPALMPSDRTAAREARMLDRIFDNHVMTPMQAFVANALKPDSRKDGVLVEAARDALDRSYRWLDARLAGRTWATGDAFSIADCAGGPALFYADWVHGIPESCQALRAYRARVLGRPSVMRCVDEARPYRHFFPLGAPDRD